MLSQEERDALQTARDFISDRCNLDYDGGCGRTTAGTVVDTINGLLARLTPCAVPDGYKLVNTNSAEANNVAALRASDVRTTDVDASPSNIPAETYQRSTVLTKLKDK